MQSLRVGFLSFQDYLDRNAWSGSLYYMQTALRARGVQVVYLGEQKKAPLGKKILEKLLRRLGKSSTSPKLGSPQYIAECQKLASTVKDKLAQTPCDVIFAPVASAELMFLETRVPIIYLSDATFKLYRELYEVRFDQQESDWAAKQEFTAISKASKIIYSSQWAANSAISDYQAKSEKIKVIPFGANLDNPPLAELALSKKHTSSCRLLLVGKEWDRKGGDVAFQTLLSLHKKGVNAELIIVGCKPPQEIKHDNLTVIPYLDKNIPQQRKQLDELFLSSHFFLLPTRADCSPVVTCEANAFGLPVLTTNIGGIPTIIREGKNGYTLPLSATGDDYAKLIVENFSDETVYQNLVRASRQEYDARLNWDHWSESFCNLAMDLVEKKNLQQPIASVERVHQWAVS